MDGEKNKREKNEMYIMGASSEKRKQYFLFQKTDVDWDS